eukprot:scaffold145586_cov23-Cyclotella_meneghiniana.AAC.1
MGLKEQNGMVHYPPLAVSCKSLLVCIKECLGSKHNKFQLPSSDEDEKAAVKISFTPMYASVEPRTQFLLQLAGALNNNESTIAA